MHNFNKNNSFFFIAGSGDSSCNVKMVSESCKQTNDFNSDQLMANGNNAGSALSKVTVLTVNKYI